MDAETTIISLFSILAMFMGDGKAISHQQRQQRDYYGNSDELWKRIQNVLDALSGMNRVDELAKKSPMKGKVLVSKGKDDFYFRFGILFTMVLYCIY